MQNHMKIHPLITDSETLADLCARLAKADFVTVDTEFMRENTFWPELCLIQIADEQRSRRDRSARPRAST
jgi:ribonuclease D